MFTLFLIARFETTHMDMAVSFLHSLALISSCSRSIVVLLKPGNKHVGASKAIAICCTFCFCNVLQRYLFENRMMQEQKKDLVEPALQFSLVTLLTIPLQRTFRDVL